MPTRHPCLFFNSRFFSCFHSWYCCHLHGSKSVLTLAATVSGFAASETMTDCSLSGPRTGASASKFPAVKTAARTIAGSEAKRMTGAASRRAYKTPSARRTAPMGRFLSGFSSGFLSFVLGELGSG